MLNCIAVSQRKEDARLGAERVGAVPCAGLFPCPVAAEHVNTCAAAPNYITVTWHPPYHRDPAPSNVFNLFNNYITFVGHVLLPRVSHTSLRRNFIDLNNISNTLL